MRSCRATRSRSWSVSPCRGADPSSGRAPLVQFSMRRPSGKPQPAGACTNVRPADPLRRRRRLRALHGQVEPARRRGLPRLARATHRACAGSTSAAATAPSPRCWSSAARPSRWHGVDPSAAQLAFARTRPAARLASFRQGDAMALPFPDDAFDAAVMPLVIFFVPEPAKGVAEMARVVCPGGTVAAYGWDLHGGGFPVHDAAGRDARAGRRARRCRRARTRHASTSCRTCGRARASTPSRRARSPCGAPSTTSRTAGRRSSPGPASARGSPRWRRGSRAPEGADALAAAGGRRRVASPYAARANAVKGRVPS